MDVKFTILIIGYFIMETYCVKSLPGKPTDIHVLADSFNIGVQWTAPSQTYGTIQNYIVGFAVLPNRTEYSNTVDGQDMISTIPVETHIGRLYRIRVRAQNDVGLGPYSDVRYIRIKCSETYDLFPNTRMKIRSPGYESRDPLEPGLLCTWRLKTIPQYEIKLNMDDIMLVDNENKTGTWNCSTYGSGSYLDVEGNGKYCGMEDIILSFKTPSLSEQTLTLKTGTISGGRGFELTAVSVMRLPGLPTHIHISKTDHAVIVTWQRPVEKTLPVTSYILRYRVLQNRRFYRVTVGPKMQRFSLNVNKFEGRLLMVNLSAAIGFQEGRKSKPVFVRAPCRRQLHIEKGRSVNVTSPNYPSYYPANILCTWELTAEPEVTLFISFLDFRLEDTSFCSSDYLLFSFKEDREPECSRMRNPKTINTGTSSFTMTFVTDFKNQFEGFLLRVEAKGKNDDSVTSTTQVSVHFTTTQLKHGLTGGDVTIHTMKQSPKHGLTGGDVTIHTAKQFPASSVLDVNAPSASKPTSAPHADGSNVSSSIFSSALVKGFVKETTPIYISKHDRIGIQTHSKDKEEGGKALSHELNSDGGTTNNVGTYTALALFTRRGAVIHPHTDTMNNVDVVTNTSLRESRSPSYSTTQPSVRGHERTVSINVIDTSKQGPTGHSGKPLRDTHKPLSNTQAAVSYTRKPLRYTRKQFKNKGNTEAENEVLPALGGVSLRGNSVPESYQGKTTTLNVSKDVDEINVGLSKHRTSDFPIREVIGAIGAVLVVIGILVGLYGYRQRRLKMKIDIQRSENNKFGDVELHDIINCQNRKQSNSYETFEVTKVRETSLTGIQNGQTGNGISEGRSQVWPNNVPRRRHYSFPYSARNRKMNRQMEQKISAFKFIEDKDQLEIQIRRTQNRRRTNSI